MTLSYGGQREEKHKVVVVGLDGVPFSLLNNLKKGGYIPNMASIFDNGYFGQMSVSIPEVSSVSWSSFMSGTQSGEHGIFGFMDLKPGTYKIYFPNFSHFKSRTLWENLADQGQQSVVINMPATYPARKMNGSLISGFVVVDFNKAVYPPAFIPRLSDVGYRIDIDTVRARQDYNFLFQDLDVTLKGRERAVHFLWNQIDWTLFIVVITGTDRLMHFLWDAFEEEGHPYHNAFLDYFRKLDGFVGRVYDRFLQLESSERGKNQFYMLSDHGFAKIKAEVYLNRWLYENGYLKFQKDQPDTIMDIGPGSTAFALDPSRIYINLKGKYPYGIVDSSDYERVRQEIKEGLEGMTFEGGKKIAKRVYFKEELYEGPCLKQAPDLVVLSHHGFDLKGRIDCDALFGRTNLVGMHTQNDAFFYSSTGIECNSIFELKRKILDSNC